MKVTCITHIHEKSEEYLAWVGQSSESFKEHLQSTLEQAKESHNLSKMRMKADRDKKDEIEMMKERILEEARLKKEKQYEEEAQSLRKKMNEKLEALLKESLQWKRKYEHADDNQLKCENEVFKFCEKYYFKEEKLFNAEREIKKLKRKLTWFTHKGGNQKLTEIEELSEIEALYSKVSQTEKESLKWQSTYQESAENLKTSKMENTKWHHLYKQIADNLHQAERDSFKWRSMFLQSRDNQHQTGEDNEKLNELHELSAQVKESNKWHKIRQVRLDTISCISRSKS